MAGTTGGAWAAEDDACAGDCFVLTRMTIQGVTAYPLADLAGAYDQKLARRIGVQDLVQTATAITDHYRRDGYFLTRATVAPHDGSTGSASIIVYEGYIGEVAVTGSGSRAVTPILKPLEGRRVLTIGELDRRLALASDIPGIHLTSRIEPFLDDPARHRLVVTADLDRADGGVFAENRGSPAQGPWQVYLSGGVNSAVVAGDRTTFAALTVPDQPDELTFAEWTYSAPLSGGRRIKASVSGYTASATPGAADTWLSGRSHAAAVTLSQPLLRGRDRSLWANAGLDVREVKQTYVGSDQASERLTVARVSLSGRQKIEGGYLSAWAQLSQGLDAFGATTRPSPSLTRRDATAVFTKVNLGLSGYRDLGRYAGVYGEVSTQWTDDPLLSSEEFYVGGANLGRAFNYGEIGGDKGAAGLVELRVGWDPKTPPVSFFQMYGFVDAGRVFNLTPAGQTAMDLSSAGVGTRVTLQQRATLRFELAKPLTRTPYTEPDKDWRVFVSLSKEF